MPQIPPDDAETLAALRSEIDEIDEAMHSLLQRRANVIQSLVLAKKTRTGAAFRPDREAHMMQRLGMRHRGELPFLTIAHIWRVIISTFTQLQAPYRVYLGGEESVLRDIARYQFGFSTPLVACSDRAGALAALGENSCDLALVLNGGDTPWWTSGLERGCQVIAILPEIDGGDRDMLQPSMVFASVDVDVSALPRVVFALSSQQAGPLACLLEAEGCITLSGPVDRGTQALVVIDRARAESFTAMAASVGVTLRPAGGAANPVGPA